MRDEKGYLLLRYNHLFFNAREDGGLYEIPFVSMPTASNLQLCTLLLASLDVAQNFLELFFINLATC